MTITVVVVRVPAVEAELAADRLWSAGAGAIEERHEGDTVELRTVLGDRRELITVALDGIAWPWHLETLDPAVADTWRAFAEPTVVDDRIVVTPAWVAPPPGPQDIHLFIEPGPTFGLGNHPTTVLSLRALHHAITPGDRVLDVGTGSGVLSIAAIRLGAAHALGIDTMPACLDVAPANAALNGVGDRVTVRLGDLDDLHEPFDVVVANILAPVIVELAPDLRRLTGRTLIVSGLLADRTEHVVDALRPLTVWHTTTLDGWAALTLGR